MSEYNRGSLGLEDPPPPDFLRNRDLVDLENLEGEGLLKFKEASLRTLLENDPSKMKAETLLEEIDKMRQAKNQSPYRTISNFRAGMTVRE